MALLRRSGTRFTTNIWPGFVDAMTALLLVLMFVLSIFMIIQTIFREKISGQQTELTKLQLEVSDLVSNLKGQKEQYEALSSFNIAIKKDLKVQRQENLERSKKLKNAVKNLDLANVKISDFEVRMASLIARRTQLLTQIDQKDNRLKKEISRLESSRLALSAARDEIDLREEAARLAAAKREALEIMVSGLKSNLNKSEKDKNILQANIKEKDLALLLAYENLESTKDRLDATERRSLIKQAAIENLKEQLTVKSDLIDKTAKKVLGLESDLAKSSYENQELTKEFEANENMLTTSQEELILERIAVEHLSEKFQSTIKKLDESERQILVEKLAIKNLRSRLAESREELELATLSLEEERKRALDNLELIAASEKAMKVLKERNINLLNERDLIESKLLTTSDLLKVRESSISQLRSQVFSNETEKKVSLLRIKKLNEETLSLASQLSQLQNLLGDYERKDAENTVQVENLGGRLNAALAIVVLEQKKNKKLEAERLLKLESETRDLRNYRSEFFGNLRKILGNKKGIEVAGDRFLLPSEILFTSGSYELELAGRSDLAQIAIVIRKILKEIPDNIDWLLRVDGHTDKTKVVSTVNFKDNWELSQARALSVVRYFVNVEGLPAKRFAAAGFGEFQPIELGGSEKALARNRRIEIKLTER